MKKIVFFLPIVILLFILTSGAYAAPGKQWDTQVVSSGYVSPSFGYTVGWSRFFHSVQNPGPDQMYKSLHDLLIAETVLTKGDLAGLSEAEIRDVAHSMGFVYYVTELEGLSNQRWAAEVESEPGHSGTLKQKFEAACGPYDSDFSQGITDEIRKDSFGFGTDLLGNPIVVKGEDFVGNYFNIEQLVATSQGTTRRFINISSPWSGSYLYEDMHITGRSEISETFRMHNLGPGGLEKIPKWWHFF